MSSLLLIRHGQASFFAKVYDRLSPLGEEQARCLGRFWAELRLRRMPMQTLPTEPKPTDGQERRAIAFDEVITGPRERHRATAGLALEAVRSAGVSCSAPREDADFDEHQLEQLLRDHRKALLPHLPEAAAWHEPAGASRSTEEAHRRFRRLLEAATGHWLEGGPGAASVESWPAFQKRVRAGLTRIVDREGHGRRVAVITSAGVIGVALQQALGCSDAQAMALSRRLRNASLTEFVFSGGRFTLDSFNGLPHLQDQRAWTYL